MLQKGQLDYSNTRFHNALVQKHELKDQAFQEELERCAYDMAKQEATKRNIQKAQAENQKSKQEKAAKERGKDALAKEMGKRDMAIYEKEMKKIQMKEGWEKIQ